MLFVPSLRTVSLCVYVCVGTSKQKRGRECGHVAQSILPNVVWCDQIYIGSECVQTCTEIGSQNHILIPGVLRQASFATELLPEVEGFLPSEFPSG